MFFLIWTTLLFSVRGSDNKGQTQIPTGVFQTTLAPGNGKSAPPNAISGTVCTSAGGVLPANATDESDNSTATGKNTNLELNTLEDFFTMLLDNVKQPQVIIAFCTGIILSAFICCLTRTCHRKKPKTSENMVETLEMVTTQALPLMDGAQSLENDGAPAEAAEGAEAAAKEVEYSDIDLYRLSRKNPGEAEDDVQKTAETEYAEIKREAVEQRQEDGEQEDGEQEGEAVEGEEAKEAEGDEEEQQVVEEELPVFEDHEATGE